MASVWGDIFHHPDDESVLEDTVSCISWMYRQMEYGYKNVPGLLYAPFDGIHVVRRRRAGATLQNLGLAGG